MRSREGYEPFIERYAVTREELRESAGVAILLEMQGKGSHVPEEAERHVQELAERYEFRPEELNEMAWKVVRGAFTGPAEETASILHFAMQVFLSHAVPAGEAFSHTGAQQAFRPAENGTPSLGVEVDLLLRDLGALLNEDETPLAGELRSLYVDAGILI